MPVVASLLTIVVQKIFSRKKDSLELSDKKLELIQKIQSFQDEKLEGFIKDYEEIKNDLEKYKQINEELKQLVEKEKKYNAALRRHLKYLEEKLTEKGIPFKNLQHD